MEPRAGLLTVRTISTILQPVPMQMMPVSDAQLQITVSDKFLIISTELYPCLLVLSFCTLYVENIVSHYLFQTVDSERFDWLVMEARHLKDEWKSATITSGAVFVMIHGIILMQQLLATSLVTVH